MLPTKGLEGTYLFTTQFPWTNIATFWMPRRTATESTEGPRRLIRLAKGMTFTEEDTGDVRQAKRRLGSRNEASGTVGT